MFGGFSVTHHDEQGEPQLLTDQNSSSKRLWGFLQYLIHHHASSVPQDSIIDLLWRDAETEDPVNTLKTMLHRTRKSLESIGIEDAKQVLLYRHGNYSWSNSIEFVIDTEMFEQLYERAQHDSPHRLQLMLDAIKLYRGVFLPKSSNEPWIISLRMYYHTMFLRLCSDAAHLLELEGRILEIIDLCRRALHLEPYDEDIHLLIMRALVKNGSQQAAIQHYNYVTKLFKDELGVSPSDKLTQFYRELIKSTQSVEMDLCVIQEGLAEPSPGAGPYYCEYAIFQDVYRLEARTMERTGYVMQLALLTVVSSSDKALTTKQISSAMERLHHVIVGTLRRGDTFTRFSATQFLLLLPCSNYENGTMIVNRLISRFKRQHSSSNLHLQHSVLPLVPSESTPQIAPVG